MNEKTGYGGLVLCSAGEHGTTFYTRRMHTIQACHGIRKGTISMAGSTKFMPLSVKLWPLATVA